MTQFTEAQLEQLANMGFIRGAAPGSVFMQLEQDDVHWQSQMVWTSSQLSRSQIELGHSVYDYGADFVADDHLNRTELGNGLGVGFDCPIAAATWLLLQEANRA